MYNKLAEMVTTGIDIKARVLINRVDNRTTEGREAFKIVEKNLNLPRFQTIISQRVAYSGVPAMGHLREDDARKEIEPLYREIKEWLNIELSLH